jgi:hypothetical protein
VLILQAAEPQSKLTEEENDTKAAIATGDDSDANSIANPIADPTPKTDTEQGSKGEQHVARAAVTADCAQLAADAAKGDELAVLLVSKKQKQDDFKRMRREVDAMMSVRMDTGVRVNPVLVDLHGMDDGDGGAADLWLQGTTEPADATTRTENKVTTTTITAAIVATTTATASIATAAVATPFLTTPCCRPPRHYRLPFLALT